MRTPAVPTHLAAKGIKLIAIVLICFAVLVFIPVNAHAADGDVIIPIDGDVSVTKNPSGAPPGYASILDKALSNGEYVVFVEDEGGNIHSKRITITNIQPRPDLGQDEDGNDIISSDDGVTEYTEEIQNEIVKNITVDSNGIYAFSVKDQCGNAAYVIVKVENIDVPVPTPNPDNIIEPEPAPETPVPDDPSGGDITLPEEEYTEEIERTGTTGAEVTENGEYVILAKDQSGNIVMKTILVDNIKHPEPELDDEGHEVVTPEEPESTENPPTPSEGEEEYTENIVGVKTERIIVDENGIYAAIAKDQTGEWGVISYEVDNIEEPIVDPGENDGVEDVVVKESDIIPDEGEYTEEINGMSIKSIKVDENGLYAVTAKDVTGNFNLIQKEVTSIAEEDPNDPENPDNPDGSKTEDTLTEIIPDTPGSEFTSGIGGKGSDSLVVTENGWYAASSRNTAGCIGVQEYLVKCIGAPYIEVTGNPAALNNTDGAKITFEATAIDDSVITEVYVTNEKDEPISFNKRGKDAYEFFTFANGTYTITVVDLQGRSSELSFDVSCLFELKVEEQEAAAVNGSSVTLSVEAIGGTPDKYQWYTATSADYDNPQKILGQTSSEYKFTARQELNDCYYFCVASVGTDYNVISDIIHLKVYTPPKVTITGAQSIVQGNSVDIVAAVTEHGEPDVYTFTWYYTESGTRDVEHDPVIDVDNNRAIEIITSEYSSILHIENADSIHNGNYYCVISNGGSGVQTLVSNLVVFYAPKIESTGNQLVPVNEKATFATKITENGFPSTYSYVWYKQMGDEPDTGVDTVVTSNENINIVSTNKGSTLTILAAKQENVGSYYCVVGNSKTTVQSDVMELVVCKSPSLPSGISTIITAKINDTEDLPSGTWTNRSIFFTLGSATLSDVGEGELMYRYSLDGKATWVEYKDTFIYGLSSVQDTDGLTMYAQAYNSINPDINVECSYLIKFDASGPEAKVTYTPKTWTNGDVEVSATANDGKGIGLAEKPFSYDGGVTWTTEFHRTLVQDETFDLQIADLLGNITHETCVVDWIDKEAPMVSAKNVSVNERTGCVNVLITATDAHRPSTPIEYCWNYTNTASDVWVSFNTKECAPGVTLTLAARDAAGNVSSAFMFVPSTVIDGNNGGGYGYGGTISVIDKVYTDISGYILGKDKYLDAEGEVCTYTDVGSVTGLPIKISISDDSNAYATGYVMLQNKKFPITWYTDADCTSLIEIDGEAKYDETGNYHITDGGAVGRAVINPSVILNSSQMVDATIYVTVYKNEDLTGKLAEYKHTMTVSTDVSAPVVTATFNQYQTGTNKVVSVVARDSLSGLQTAQYRINGGAWTEIVGLNEYGEANVNIGSITGKFTIDIASVDMLGNIGTKTLQFSTIAGDTGSASVAAPVDAGTNVYHFKTRLFDQYLVGGLDNN